MTALNSLSDQRGVPVRGEIAPVTRPSGVPSPEDPYRLSVALLEDEEAKLWRAVRAMEPGEDGPGARSLRARHHAALRGIFLEHSRRLYDAAERGPFVTTAEPQEATPRFPSKGFTVYSDRGRTPGGSRKGKVRTWEATLLPSMGYETREDAEMWAWSFRKANPGLKVEIR